MNDYSEELRTAIDLINWGGTVHESTLDAIEALAKMFEPYPGDDAAEARERKPHPVRCTNCGLIFPGFYVPAPAAETASMMARGSFCPRCHATASGCIVVGWDAEASDVAVSFPARVIRSSTAKLGWTNQDLNMSLRLEVNGPKGDVSLIKEQLPPGSHVMVTTTPETAKGKPPT